MKIKRFIGSLKVFCREFCRAWQAIKDYEKASKDFEKAFYIAEKRRKGK